MNFSCSLRPAISARNFANFFDPLAAQQPSSSSLRLVQTKTCLRKGSIGSSFKFEANRPVDRKTFPRSRADSGLGILTGEIYLSIGPRGVDDRP
jgi:hypothetical protein